MPDDDDDDDDGGGSLVLSQSVTSPVCGSDVIHGQSKCRD